MLDFKLLREKQVTIVSMSSELSRDDLKRATHDMLDTICNLIADCQDADVTFTPQDPLANDPYACDPEEVHRPWTLGHVIVHLTASLEESAALAAEMARGVEFHGRSRYETPWQNVLTVEQCRRRLEECRRMCLGSLQMWPEAPHYEINYCPWTGAGKVDARGRYLLGLKHADDHLGQIADIVQQAGSQG
jgi:hypothetical protein